MGVFGFFRRRRDRETALPGESPESVTRALKGEGEPIGQHVQGVGQPALDLSNLGGIAGTFSMLRDMHRAQEAFQAGGFQMTHGPVIDARGAESLREDIMNAMREHGIDPDDPANSQVDASAMPALQAKIMETLKSHGIDAGQMGAGGMTIESSGDDPAA